MKPAKTFMKNVKLAGGLLLLCAALISPAPAAKAAADAASLDLSQTGSVKVTLYSDETNAVVTDGALTLYQVATLGLEDGNMAWTLTEAFGDCQVALDVTESTMADKLAAYVQTNSIQGVTKTAGTDGTVTFDGLQLGLYLVAQTTQSTGYYAIAPFAVTVPIEAGGAWVYSVDATPKCETLKEEETELVASAETEIETESETETEAETTAQSETAQSETETPENLPQTGQLYWPIAILTVCGVLFLAFGCVLLRNDRRKEGK
ncbi:MAG: hypothetical protein LUG99_20850 [Lachnospiraceae bacterium]|nr:hypothetical protein [Lachnospiraceae bacterium]